MPGIMRFLEIRGGVDNPLIIGGRNYILDTSDTPKTVTWTDWDHVIINPLNALDIIKKGAIYTFSVYIQKPTNDSCAFVQFNRRTVNRDWEYQQFYGNTILEGESGQSVVTFQMKPDLSEGVELVIVSIRNIKKKLSNKNTATYHSPKLEKGTVPTDWTPAPEDIYAEINELRQEINKMKG